MNINFPLLLVIAVFLTGIIWLIDGLFFARKRKAAVRAVDAQFKTVQLEAGSGQEALALAREVAGKEPALVEYSKSFFPVLFVVLVLRSFLVEPFQIPSGSMIPTLEIGDFILVNKFTYGIRLPVVHTKVVAINEPKRGDVMVFFPPHKPDTYYIKRVIGLPGDEIVYRDNVLYINGEKQEQKLLASLPPSNPQLQITQEQLGSVSHVMQKSIPAGHYGIEGRWLVPEGHYFMMGDNRDNSLDSRAWGPVAESAIVGRAFAVWMHWESLLSVPSFGNVGLII